MTAWLLAGAGPHVFAAVNQGSGGMMRDIDEAEELLLKWADWMRSGIEGPEGYPGKVIGMIVSWVKDNDDLCEAADDYEMAKIQAAIDSLVPGHQRVIYKRHEISHMVWSFPNEDALYLAAKGAFRARYFFATKDL